LVGGFAASCSTFAPHAAESTAPEGTAHSRPADVARARGCRSRSAGAVARSIRGLSNEDGEHGRSWKNQQAENRKEDKEDKEEKREKR
jgi:hypothetical protein